MWGKYILVYRKPLSSRTTNGIDGRYLDDKWTRTDISFKARTKEEAIKKADKFWRQGKLGMGSIDVRQV